MNNSIQYFLENGIPGLEKIKKDFFTGPVCFDEYIEKVKGIVLDFGCHIISEVLEECNTLLEESLKRRLPWGMCVQGNSDASCAPPGNPGKKPGRACCKKENQDFVC